MNRIMVLKAHSPAIHKLGDIGDREDDSFIRIGRETEKNYFGHFEEGFGFVGVKFSKENVRPLTEEELEKVNHCFYTLNGHPMYKLNFDKNGIKNYIGGNTLMEIGFAYVNNKKVFLLNPIPEKVPYTDEIKAMVDVVLDGNLGRIS